MLEETKKTLLNSPIVHFGDYNYFVNPITDGIPTMKPQVLLEITEVIQKNFNLNVDKIVSVEAMGIPLATSLSIATNIPSLIIRKRNYGLPGEVTIHKYTGYAESNLYVNDLKAGDRILLIDDVVSTGGTLINLIKGLRQIGVDIVTCIAVIDKGEGKLIVEKETGCKVDTIVKLHIDKGKVVIDKIIGE